MISDSDITARPYAAVRPDAAAAGTEGRFERNLGTALLLILAVGCFVVLRPFISAVIWAVILSLSTWPIYVRLEHLLGNRRTLAALVMTLSAAILFLAPVAVLGSHLASQLSQVAGLVSTWLTEGPPGPPAWVATVPLVGGRLDAYWQTIANDGGKLTADLKPYIGPARDWLLNVGGSLAAGIGELTLSLLIAFFLYRDGTTGVRALGAVLGHVAGSRGERIMETAGSTIKGVVYGILGTNFVQATLAMIGLWAVGVPGALFLGFITFFLTLIPTGPAIIFVPAILWLLQQGATIGAIFLAIWFIIVFMLLDGVLRAFFISRGGELPLILVLLGILGGIMSFGLLGIFVGPTILAIGHALLQEWTKGGTSHGLPASR
ncbi:MAG: AI-2E family transporter [Alphaproteobacteria bacterium]|nr:AI-2E family transporter [Alphaproteobacteria bacterium]